MSAADKEPTTGRDTIRFPIRTRFQSVVLSGRSFVCFAHGNGGPKHSPKPHALVEMTVCGCVSRGAASVPESARARTRLCARAHRVVVEFQLLL